MCRIAGIINPFASPELLRSWVTEMCRLQQHGGPDDEGVNVFAQQNGAFGHRRLSIIDLSEAGHQPMSYADGRYWITYNGELYNYIELRQELITMGCRFETNCDTEVILAAYSVWGEKAFARFNGMYAFALIDIKMDEVVLVRDVNGVKPLYYSVTKNGLAFASEIKAFKNINYLQTKGNNWQVYLMAYGHLPEPITTLQDVKPLTKGSYLKYNIHTQNHTVNYYSHFTYTETIGNRKNAIELITDSLRKAVKRNLVADAPIGVFLSGGLDSSILALLANEEKQSMLRMISIFFDEKGYSEKKYQDLLQQKLHSQQFQHLVSEDEFHNYLPDIIKAMDMPSCDGINTWFISKYAKEGGLKAVLSGIGGDELFGGYPSFNRITPTLLMQHMPDMLLKGTSYIGGKAFKRLPYLTIDGTIGRYLFLRGQFVPLEIAKTLNANEAEVMAILRDSPITPIIDSLSAKNQASWMEMNLYMQNQLLRDADVMSMAHGLEIRVPFLDNELIQLALQIKSGIKYAGSNKKQMLIDAFKDKLPQSIWDRPKMGFAFPFREWLLNNNIAKEQGQSYKKLKSGSMHWSQFLTLLLIDNHGEA